MILMSVDIHAIKIFEFDGAQIYFNILLDGLRETQ